MSLLIVYKPISLEAGVAHVNMIIKFKWTAKWGRERDRTLVFLALKWVPTSKYQELWLDTWSLILS
jgi:hypothetical protein